MRNCAESQLFHKMAGRTHPPSRSLIATTLFFVCVCAALPVVKPPPFSLSPLSAIAAARFSLGVPWPYRPISDVALALEARVHGQPSAVSGLLAALRGWEADLASGSARPLVLCFTGFNGVGKTLAAGVVAAALTASDIEWQGWLALGTFTRTSSHPCVKHLNGGTYGYPGADVTLLGHAAQLAYTCSGSGVLILDEAQSAGDGVLAPLSPLGDGGTAGFEVAGSSGPSSWVPAHRFVLMVVSDVGPGEAAEHFRSLGEHVADGATQSLIAHALRSAYAGYAGRWGLDLSSLSAAFIGFPPLDQAGTAAVMSGALRAFAATASRGSRVQVEVPPAVAGEVGWLLTDPARFKGYSIGEPVVVVEAVVDASPGTPTWESHAAQDRALFCGPTPVMVGCACVLGRSVHPTSGGRTALVQAESPFPQLKDGLARLHRAAEGWAAGGGVSPPPLTPGVHGGGWVAETYTPPPTLGELVGEALGGGWRAALAPEPAYVLRLSTRCAPEGGVVVVRLCRFVWDAAGWQGGCTVVGEL